jgi:hypothetical protein
VRIVAGADQFEPPSAGSPELNTLENKAYVDPDPQQFRLACLAKIRGPVKLALPE